MYKFTRQDLAKLKQYEDAFRQARLGYYRNMTSSKKEELKRIVESSNGAQSLCLNCSASFLNFLNRVGESYYASLTIFSDKETKNKNNNEKKLKEETTNGKTTKKVSGQKDKKQPDGGRGKEGKKAGK